jgi:hypothetical protein
VETIMSLIKQLWLAIAFLMLMAFGISFFVSTLTAKSYLEEIIISVTSFPKKIIKVRAGYILDEVLNIEDKRIQQWLAAAQRGSSQVLDPETAFRSTFSEKWMLSLNV